MLLNIPIIFDKLKDFSPKIHYTQDIDLNLSQIRIFHEGFHSIQKEYLYLVEAPVVENNSCLFIGSSLIVFGYVDAQFAEKNDLSIILLDNNNNRNLIFDKVQSIFEYYERWHQELLYSIIKHEPLQALLDAGASVLTNPIVLLDESLALVAKSGHLPENFSGTIWEAVLTHGFSPIELFPEEDRKIIFKKYLESSKPFIYKSPQRFPKTQWLTGGISIDGELKAVVGSVDILQTITKGQLSLIYHIMAILELAFANDPDFASISEKNLYYIYRLLKDFHVDKNILEYHLSKKNWHADDYYRIYTFSQPDKETSSKSVLDAYQFRIKPHIKNGMIFPYENSIVAIVWEGKNKTDKHDNSELNQLLTQLSLKCGISVSFSGFSNLKYYYIQSKVALSEGEKCNQDAKEYYFLDYYLSHIINSLDNATSLRSLCNQDVLKLRDYSTSSGNDYLNWLLTYLINGLNLSQTAQKLHVHRNTMVYRLDKIKELLNTELDDLDDSMVLYLILSCIICEYSLNS